jgi:hypothetical protein
VIVGLQLLCQVLIISVLFGADEETCWRVLVKGKEVVEDVFGLLLIPPLLLKVLLINKGLLDCLDHLLLPLAPVKSVKACALIILSH